MIHLHFFSTIAWYIGIGSMFSFVHGILVDDNNGESFFFGLIWPIMVIIAPVGIGQYLGGIIREKLTHD